MDFGDGLANNGKRGGGAGSRGELLEDIESGLVLLTTLQNKIAVSMGFCPSIRNAPFDTYNSHANPRLGQVD